MTTANGGEGGHHIDRQEDPSEAVLKAVADETGETVLDLPPLQDAVDVEAMDRLLRSDKVELLKFEYREFIVTVEPTRVILSALE